MDDQISKISKKQLLDDIAEMKEILKKQGIVGPNILRLIIPEGVDEDEFIKMIEKDFENIKVLPKNSLLFKS